MAKKEDNEILRYFNEQVAKKLGVYEAIVIQQIEYWIRANTKKKIHCCEGYYWTYNTIEEWALQFPFWSEKTTKRILKQLRDNGYLITENKYNKRKADKTLWYRINYDKLNEVCGAIIYQSQGPVCPQENDKPKGQVDPVHKPSLSPAKGQFDPKERDSLSPTLPIVSNSFTKASNSFKESSSFSPKGEAVATPLLINNHKWFDVYEVCFSRRFKDIPAIPCSKVDITTSLLYELQEDLGWTKEQFEKELTEYLNKYESKYDVDFAEFVHSLVIPF